MSTTPFNQLDRFTDVPDSSCEVEWVGNEDSSHKPALNVRSGSESEAEASVGCVLVEEELDAARDACFHMSRRGSMRMNSSMRLTRRNSGLLRLLHRTSNFREKLCRKKKKSDTRKSSMRCETEDDNGSESSKDHPSSRQGTHDIVDPTSVDVVAIKDQIIENALLKWRQEQEDRQQDDDDGSWGAVASASESIGTSTLARNIEVALSPIVVHPTSHQQLSEEAQTSASLLVAGREVSQSREEKERLSTSLEHQRETRNCYTSEAACDSTDGLCNVANPLRLADMHSLEESELGIPFSQIPTRLLPRTDLVPLTPSPTPPCSPFPMIEQGQDSRALRSKGQPVENCADADQGIRRCSLLESMLQRLTIKDDIIAALKPLSPSRRDEAYMESVHANSDDDPAGNETSHGSSEKTRRRDRCAASHPLKSRPTSANSHRMRALMGEARAALLSHRKQLLQERAQKKALTDNLSQMTTQVQLLRVLLAVFAHHLEQNGIPLADLPQGVFP